MRPWKGRSRCTSSPRYPIFAPLVTKTMNKAFIIPAILLFAACGNDPQGTAGTGSENTPTSTTTAASTEDPRDTWQQPAEVLRMIEEGQADKNLTGKVVADLFCGDGYFTMKLLERGATVIAIDIKAGDAIAAELGEVSVFALNLTIGLGLGLAIDYSLFMISRYREEIARSGPGREALLRTMQQR